MTEITVPCEPCLGNGSFSDFDGYIVTEAECETCEGEGELTLEVEDSVAVFIEDLEVTKTRYCRMLRDSEDSLKEPKTYVGKLESATIDLTKAVRRNK